MRPANEPRKVLFVCTGNSCRSVMAEGLLRDLAERSGKDILVASAGTSAGEGYRASEPTVRVMAQHGIDVSRHRSHRLTMDMVLGADEIYVMERVHRDIIVRTSPEARPKVRLLSQVCPDLVDPSDPNIPDPIGMPEQFYRNVYDMIRQCVERILDTPAAGQ
ncbi:MAG: Protein-arginine-phosphatase [Candidatus Omnitrophica bacterium]|nr:Protein-arginine-phosphatase [Candidatus Omnitrophota bacterium]